MLPALKFGPEMQRPGTSFDEGWNMVSGGASCITSHDKPVLACPKLQLDLVLGGGGGERREGGSIAWVSHQQAARRPLERSITSGGLLCGHLFFCAQRVAARFSLKH